MKIKLIGVILVFPLIILGCSGYYSNGLSGDISISPDDRDIVFSFHKGKTVSIYKYSIDGNNIIRLTWPKNEAHFNPVYSSLKRLTNLAAYYLGNLSISPDGKRPLFYYEKYEEKNRFFILNLENLGEIIPIMPADYISPVDIYWQPQFSPDAKRISFAAVVNRTGTYTYELFIMNADTKQARQLTSLRGCIHESRFFHHQNSILFMQDMGWPSRKSSYRFMKIDADGSNLTQINIPFDKVAE